MPVIAAIPSTIRRYTSILTPFSSFGVIKYANKANATKDIPSIMLDNKEYFPAKKLVITPAVSVYLAASAKILPITFLLSLSVTMHYTTKN